MSTQEASRGILEVKELTDLWNEMAPEEWKYLPKADSMVYQYNDGALGGDEYSRRIAIVKPCLLKCEGVTPTKEEVTQLFDMVHQKGIPVAFLCKLSSLEFPSFDDGLGPTVEEFFKGEFDVSTVKVQTAIVIYPAIEE